MKKYIYSTLASFALIGCMTSCEDVLDSVSGSATDESAIYSKYEFTTGAIAGVYHSLFETNAYRGRILPFYGYNTDIEWYNTHTTKNDDRHDLHTYNITALNGQFNIAESKDPWSKVYEAVERVNLVISGIEKYGNPTEGSDMGQLLGEALCLRAMLYNDLTNIWGDVPGRFEPITSETIYMERTSRDDIYKQLILDLQKASTLLFWPNQHERTTTVENPSRSYAQGLLARICLKAAGYSQRNDKGESVVRKYNGQDKLLQERNLYQIAYDACTDVINSNTNRLEGDFETVFRNLAKDVTVAGKESIFELPFASDANGTRGRIFYTFAVKHNAKDQYQQGGAGRGGQAGPTPPVFYDYEVTDTRRDVTCVNYEWSNANPAVQELKNVNKWGFGKYRYEWADRMVTSSNDDGFNWMCMRYSDIVLMAAEAANYLEGADAAMPYMKQIRQRAFAMSEWSDKVDSYLDSRKGEMLEAIIDERALEFCGELLRKADLIRWNRLKSNMDVAKGKMYQLRAREGKYADLPKKVSYRYKVVNDKETEELEVYGMNYGELEDKSNEYTTTTDYLTDTKITDDEIEYLYNPAKNPDDYQFYPIFDCIISASNGKVVNDPWYK